MITVCGFDTASACTRRRASKPRWPSFVIDTHPEPIADDDAPEIGVDLGLGHFAVPASQGSVRTGTVLTGS
jgi:hypothetical protein